MKKWPLLYLFFFIFNIIGCKKETVENYPDKSRFDFNGTKIVTPYSLYQINDTASNPTSSNYTLSFYAEGIGYSPFEGNFSGVGSMISLNITSSIFKTGSQNQIFKIDNLQEGLITIKDGSLYDNYNFTNNAGREVKINSGTLTIWKYKNKYKINYKITLVDDTSITGAFWDGMLIVYK